MRERIVTAMLATAVVVFLAGTALGEETSGTVRTYQGTSYKVADLSLEVFYTIGEPKETSQQPAQGFLPTINIMSGMSSSGGGGEQPAPPGAGAGKEEPLLRGHSRVSDIVVSRQGVEFRVAVDRIRAMRFARSPVAVPGLQLPSYIPYYKYSASVSLVSGEQVDADYVNLGGTLVRGAAQGGRVEVPWEEVEFIVFDR